MHDTTGCAYKLATNMKSRCYMFPAVFILNKNGIKQLIIIHN